VTAALRSIHKEAFVDSFQKLYERCQQCVWRMAIILKVIKVNLFVSSVLFVFWYHSPNILDTPLTINHGVRQSCPWSPKVIHHLHE
jgi:hypothetical protein